MSAEFKRQVYWNRHKVISNKTYDENDYIREWIDASYQGVKRLFALAYRNRGSANRVTLDSHRRCFLPRVKIENYNIEIEGWWLHNWLIIDADLSKQKALDADSGAIQQIIFTGKANARAMIYYILE